MGNAPGHFQNAEEFLFGKLLFLQLDSFRNISRYQVNVIGHADPFIHKSIELQMFLFALSVHNREDPLFLSGFGHNGEKGGEKVPETRHHVIENTLAHQVLGTETQ